MNVISVTCTVLFISSVLYHSPAGLHRRGCRSRGHSGLQTCGEFTEELLQMQDIYNQTVVITGWIFLCVFVRQISCLWRLAQQQLEISKRTMAKILTLPDSGLIWWTRYKNKLWNECGILSKATSAKISVKCIIFAVTMLWILQLHWLREFSVLHKSQLVVPTPVLPNHKPPM